MNKREATPDERPLCPRCKKPLSWVLTKTYYEEVYGWEYDCDCIDTARLKADEVFKFTPFKAENKLLLEALKALVDEVDDYEMDNELDQKLQAARKALKEVQSDNI